ncbi:hypothetical protein [Janthinobacterium sp. FT14W]|uniref:hypothetical protein n=1 Tax=Janthinobacterium sp. FT14W TaxID=2654253 RepID=UPI00186B036F|nr:hypothetical protein [Janthinobacterium sp. FT14W]
MKRSPMKPGKPLVRTPFKRTAPMLAPAVAGLLQGKQDQTPDDAARAQLAAIKNDC